MYDEQAESEGSGQESRFRNEAPVDRPLIQELPRQLKCPGEVGRRAFAERIPVGTLYRNDQFRMSVYCSL